MARKTKSQQSPRAAYAEWKRQVATLLQRRGFLAGMLRDRDLRDLFISGATPEKAADRAETNAYNQRTSFEGGRAMWICFPFFYTPCWHFAPSSVSPRHGRYGAIG